MALVSPSLRRGGAERQMLILAGALPRDEVELRFILLAERGPLADEAEALGVPVHVLGLQAATCRGLGLRCALALARSVRSYVRLTRNVDLVDAWLVPALTLVGLAQPLARVPVFLAGRRSLADVARPRTAARRLAAALAMRQADAFVANSQAAAKDLVATDGIDPAAVHVIRNAVLPPATDLRARDRIRAGWGFGPGEWVVGCVASLQSGKGLAELVAAAGAVSERRAELRVVIVGDGPLRSDLEQQIAAHRLERVVRLDGDVGDARPLYPAFDLAVQASDSESLPNAVLEAAAAGLPIVATAVGGTLEILEDGLSGILVPPRDPAALSAAIERLAADPAARSRLGEAAAIRAQAFTPGVLAEATLGLYRSLVRQDR